MTGYLKEDIPCEGEKDDRYEGCDGQWNALEDPVDRHDDDTIRCPHRLKIADRIIDLKLFQVSCGGSLRRTV